MNLTEILNNAGAVINVILGVMAVLNPSGAAKMAAIQAAEPRGVSEIRATYGGLFLAMAVFCLVTQNQTAFTIFGCGWAGAAVVRLVSMFPDRAVNRLNFGGVLMETVIAVLLLV